MKYIIRVLKVLTIPFAIAIAYSAIFLLIFTGLGYVIFGSIDKTLKYLMNWLNKYDNWF